MKNLYCAICSKYRKFEKPKISDHIEKPFPFLLLFLYLSVICGKCKNEEEKIFKKEESIEISEVLGLIDNI